MPQIVCPHGKASWNLPVGKRANEPANWDGLHYLRLNDDDETTQITVKSIVVIGLLFQTPIPDKDANLKSLNDFQNRDMAENIALALRQKRASSLGKGSTDAERMHVWLDRRIHIIEVHSAFQHMKYEPGEIGNPYLQWQHTYQNWKDGKKQCEGCWAEKEKLEKDFWMLLGLNVLDDPSSAGRSPTS